jgi:NADH-quinone oxidoreductase subunit D
VTGAAEQRRLRAQTDEERAAAVPLEAARTRGRVDRRPWPDFDDEMILNMGPQHPSTHGVLRIMMELDSEEVVNAKAVIGYLHTGMEKTAEELTYVQGATNVTRMDYASPLSNELVSRRRRAAPRPRDPRAGRGSA